MSAPFAERSGYYVSRVEKRLDQVLPAEATSPARLHIAMRYAVFNGGKRIRPLLAYAAGECIGVSAALLDAPAAAVELIHAFSLVHDDLPAMDDDDLRRGKPTVHRQFGEATAILAADALQPLAFSVIADIDGVSASRCQALVQLFANACGSLGMTGGQSIDLDSEGKELSPAAIEHMYALKTGALIHAAIAAAAILKGDLDADQAAALLEFSRKIGIVFQIRDDVLDVEGETASIGKRTGADQRLHKATYPGLFGIATAHGRCDELLRGALEQLQVFGASAEPLRWLAQLIVGRTS